MTQKVPLPRISEQAGRPTHAEVSSISAWRYFGLMPKGQEFTAQEIAAWHDRVVDAALGQDGVAGDLGVDWSPVFQAVMGPLAQADHPFLVNARMRHLLRRLAESTGLLPSVLVRLPIGDFLFASRVLLEAQEVEAAKLPKLDANGDEIVTDGE